ncbi:MAG: response regulator [Bacteroidia bacterium]|nr:response regulator [Bacteroidia bacterium]
MNLLLIEDNVADVALMEAVLEEVEIGAKIVLNVVKDGEAALKAFTLMEEEPSSEFPDLILLDFNLPRINGLEVLKKLKKSPFLRSIPVVVFSTSSSRDDIDNCYKEYANCFITKPVDFDEFIHIIHTTVSFWSMATNKHFAA